MQLSQPPRVPRLRTVGASSPTVAGRFVAWLTPLHPLLPLLLALAPGRLATVDLEPFGPSGPLVGVHGFVSQGFPAPGCDATFTLTISFAPPTVATGNAAR